MRKKDPSGDASPISELQLDLLLALYEEPLLSSGLVSAVEEMRGEDLPLATFYRQLQKASDLGWVGVASAAGASRRSGRGRPEREYHITEDGSRVLRTGLRRYGERVELARSLGLLLVRPR